MKPLLQRVAQYVAWFAIMVYGEWWALPFLIVGAPPLIFLTFKLGAKWDINLPELG
jgi:hypothetical protein